MLRVQFTVCFLSVRICECKPLLSNAPELWYLKVKKNMYMYITKYLLLSIFVCWYFDWEGGGRMIFPKHVLLSYITWCIRMILIVHSMIDFKLKIYLVSPLIYSVLLENITWYIISWDWTRCVCETQIPLHDIYYNFLIIIFRANILHMSV